MKQFFAFILAVFYLVISSGIVVHQHYCMNRLNSANLFTSKNERCGKCGMHVTKSNGCCRDEVKIVKLQDDQKISAALSFKLKMPEAAAVQAPSFISSQVYNEKENHFNYDLPPPLLKQPLYLKHCVFRI